MENAIAFDDTGAWPAKAGTPCAVFSARSLYANLNTLIIVSDSHLI
jgi:hypothetical protein